MKKMVFVLMLVVLLLSLALPVVAMAGAGMEDPCNPGSAHGNGKCMLTAPPGLEAKIFGNSNTGKAGDNWTLP